MLFVVVVACVLCVVFSVGCYCIFVCSWSLGFRLRLLFGVGCCFGVWCLLVVVGCLLFECLVGCCAYFVVWVFYSLCVV